MLSTTLITRINRLIANSLDLPTARQKHFSFIVKRGKIVSFGFNQSYKTHPEAARFGHRFNSIHSELHAIKNFPHPLSKLSDFTLVNVRVDPTGKNKTLAKPCVKCLHLLSCLEFRDIIYTDQCGQFVKL